MFNRADNGPREVILPVRKTWPPRFINELLETIQHDGNFDQQPLTGALPESDVNTSTRELLPRHQRGNLPMFNAFGSAYTSICGEDSDDATRTAHRRHHHRYHHYHHRHGHECEQGGVGKRGEVYELEKGDGVNAYEAAPKEGGTMATPNLTKVQQPPPSVIAAIQSGPHNGSGGDNQSLAFSQVWV
ncbi:hypothetical protein OF83DRAFT_1084920 [Amylostereum chailletii]|nr:hypothetical protein OF83DRAFT_1084920 [Amylostereum chailletii]